MLYLDKVGELQDFYFGLATMAGACGQFAEEKYIDLGSDLTLLLILFFSI